MNATDKLLESLTDITYQSKQILQEGSGIMDRLLQMEARMNGVIGGTPVSVTAADKALVDEVKKIRVTYEHRLSSYPNIHNQKKYEIDAGCNVAFVLEAISHHIENPDKTFDPKRINEEAIAKTFHKLTGVTYNDKTMSTDEFRYEYRSVAFGGFRKVMILPNVLLLTRLFEASPYIVSHIDNSLILSHINNLKRYYKTVEDKFNNIAKKDPNMTVSLNGYLACLETSIRNTLIMYKAIRSTFRELNCEYKNIFHELISIDRDLANSMDESSVLYYNSLFDEIGILNETIDNLEQSLNESVTDTTNNPNQSKLSNSITNSKSFKSLTDKFIEESNINCVRRDITINNIKEWYGIISKVSDTDLAIVDQPYRIYSNITNKIDMSNFISTMQTKISFCKNQFLQLCKDDERLNSISKYDILKDILSDISLLNDFDLSGKKDIISEITDKASKKIHGEISVKTIDTLEYMFDNIINIPEYLKTINQHLKEISEMIRGFINENIQSNKIEKTKLVNEKIISAYIAYSSIISCIFYELLKFEIRSLKLVQAIMNDSQSK